MAARGADGDAMAGRRSTRPRDFLATQEARRVVQAIERAEHHTSGELRVQLEHRCAGGDPYARARIVFERLGLTDTTARNGVLIYLATRDRVFAVLGDAGIHERVPAGFWDGIVAGLAARFREDAFAEGLIWGIGEIGEQLARYFPYAGEGLDQNELPDEISLGDAPLWPREPSAASPPPRDEPADSGAPDETQPQPRP